MREAKTGNPRGTEGFCTGSGGDRCASGQWVVPSMMVKICVHPWEGGRGPDKVNMKV